AACCSRRPELHRTSRCIRFLPRMTMPPRSSTRWRPSSTWTSSLSCSSRPAGRTSQTPPCCSSRSVRGGTPPPRPPAPAPARWRAGGGRYVVGDGSMMMFVSRGMMRVGHPVVPAAEPLREPDGVLTDVVGQTCVYDSIAEDIRLAGVAPGDVLALLHQGAYCE